jgi:hypothetical protein
MSDDDQPGYLGADLMAGALEAIKRDPTIADEIRAVVTRLSARAEANENIEAVDVDVQTAVALIVRAGVPAPPLHPRKPGRHRG